jgi:hypothetical protein
VWLAGTARNRRGPGGGERCARAYLRKRVLQVPAHEFGIVDPRILHPQQLRRGLYRGLVEHHERGRRDGLRDGRGSLRAGGLEHDEHDGGASKPGWKLH